MNEEFIYIAFVLFVFSPIIVKKIINKCKKEEELPVISSSPSPKRRRDNHINLPQPEALKLDGSL
mgnify:FL=1